MKDGGPAFPRQYVGDEFSGMSLRDYFAAKAMQGLLACPGLSGVSTEIADCAYSYADAMIAQRDSEKLSGAHEGYGG